ncbi:hypothetical protein CMQ_3641 [Grosmannia clavigera kw1407]|uniref:Transmembrane protein n=1 Tax=Grosmannia clavigera (strain kw1407 / UAMH 11150) TaxID=655863 RepID=F0X9I2_GROCL|nr:uncharacterized protein CMQ_3641 [Grosmannia clavigera kw1407]EFX05572.1 hypothetical protein CMQ_3641 [Grosmannia clavigera kw1407]
MGTKAGRGKGSADHSRSGQTLAGGSDEVVGQKGQSKTAGSISSRCDAAVYTLVAETRNSLSTVVLFASPTTAFASVIGSRSLDAARTLFDKRDTTYHSSLLQDDRRLSGRSQSNTNYLPAQIGGLVGAYAASLVVVAVLILLLSKRRREHLDTGDGFLYFEKTIGQPTPETLQLQDIEVPYAVRTPLALQTDFGSASKTYVQPPSCGSVIRGVPGIDPFVDQEVVSADREMAQSQLEEMYKHVMEQEEAKAAGLVLEEPPSPLSPVSKAGQNSVVVAESSHVTADSKHRKGLSSVSSSMLLRREKGKPQGLTLNLAGSSSSGKEEPRKESRTASLLSALKSPRRKKAAMQGVNISAPIMTPMSGTFPRSGLESEELGAIPPRHYAPAAPPVPPTPDISPRGIDQRLGMGIVTTNLDSQGQTDPDSAVSQDSTAPLVGLPTSPKPGVSRFPSLASLPTSPRASGFARANAPSAVRTGGTLPLRAYQPSISSPSFATHNQTKQTVFERTMPPTPGGAQTPWTGAPVPYSPYQPFSPVIPMTPSLVTRADRKRMKRLEPKTPTMEMVRSIDDTW